MANQQSSKLSKAHVFSGCLVVFYIALVVYLSFLAPDRAMWPRLFFLSLLATGLVVALHYWGRLSTAVVLVVGIGLRLVFLPLEPTLTDDAYRYIWDGAVSASGENPYLYKPSDTVLQEFQNDPIYDLLNSKEFYTVYPPVSQLYFGISGYFYAPDWTSAYYAIKLVLVASEIIALLLLAQLVPPLLLLLYAWHPLVLIETAGQAHTESGMLLFLVLCLWFAKRNQGSLASIALALAGMIKLYPFVLFPFLWRRFKWRGLVPGGLAALALMIPFYHPDFFANIKSSLDLYVRYFEFNAGVYYGIKQVFLWWTGDDWSKSLGPFLRMIFLLGLPFIYVLDYVQKWDLAKAFLVVLAFFLMASTTIHPWYFLGLLVLVPLVDRMPWHWFWVASFSVGTYLLYVDGPYWEVVILGWAGWLLLAVLFHKSKPHTWLRQIQWARSKAKVDHISALLPAKACGLKVLDLGAGEGFVGAHLATMWQADVTLADVCDMNETSLPHTLYDGKTLPFKPKAFDITVLYFVLHHCEDPEQVLREAIRVTGSHIVIVESVYEAGWDLKLLTFLDVLANRLRSGGLMNSQEEHLSFKRAPVWKDMITSHGGTVVREHRKGKWLHKQHTFIVSLEG